MSTIGSLLGTAVGFKDDLGADWGLRGIGNGLCVSNLGCMGVAFTYGKLYSPSGLLTWVWRFFIVVGIMY